jgi:hypothetical protein
MAACINPYWLFPMLGFVQRSGTVAGLLAKAEFNGIGGLRTYIRIVSDITPRHFSSFGPS